MNFRDQACLERCIRQYGNMTADEALELAIQAATYADDCGPFDPATPRFRRDEIAFTEYARLLEQQRTEEKAA